MRSHCFDISPHLTCSVHLHPHYFPLLNLLSQKILLNFSPMPPNHLSPWLYSLTGTRVIFLLYPFLAFNGGIPWFCVLSLVFFAWDSQTVVLHLTNSVLPNTIILVWAGLIYLVGSLCCWPHCTVVGACRFLQVATHWLEGDIYQLCHHAMLQVCSIVEHTYGFWQEHQGTCTTGCSMHGGFMEWMWGVRFSSAPHFRLEGLLISVTVGLC